MKKLITPIYNKLDCFTIPKKDDNSRLEQIKLEQLIMKKACRYGVESCTNSAISLFTKFITQPTYQPNLITKDLRPLVYCEGMKYANEAEWEFLWKIYNKSDVATDKQEILDALGCSTDIFLLSRYLEWSLDDSKIRQEDIAEVFNAVANGDMGCQLARNFLYINFERIYKIVNSDDMSSILDAVSNDISNEYDLDKFEEFIKQNKDKFLTIQGDIDGMVDDIKYNVQWRHQHSEEIRNILVKYE